jgi:hypothetical protein
MILRKAQAIVLAASMTAAVRLHGQALQPLPNNQQSAVSESKKARTEKPSTAR